MEQFIEESIVGVGGEWMNQYVIQYEERADAISSLGDDCRNLATKIEGGMQTPSPSISTDADDNDVPTPEELRAVAEQADRKASAYMQLCNCLSSTTSRVEIQVAKNHLEATVEDIGALSIRERLGRGGKKESAELLGVGMLSLTAELLCLSYEQRLEAAARTHTDAYDSAPDEFEERARESKNAARRLATATTVSEMETAIECGRDVIEQTKPDGQRRSSETAD